MTFDLVFRNARISGSEDRTVDIGIRDGRFAAIEVTLPEGSGPAENLNGRLVVPGFVETHIHLDKSCLLGRCNCEQGTLEEAIAQVAAAKKGFTDEDVYTRARGTLEKSLKHGTTRMRTHVEVDPRVGLTSFRALKRLRKDSMVPNVLNLLSGKWMGGPRICPPQTMRWFEMGYPRFAII